MDETPSDNQSIAKLNTLLVCTGSKVLLPETNEPIPATIIVDKSSGKFVDIRQGQITPDQLALDATSVEWLDAGESIVLPGLVEYGFDRYISLSISDTGFSAHVHLNEPGRTAWEGFWTGTRAAASGGITTLVDMPLNSLPPTTTVSNLEEKRRAAQGQCHIDVAFWGGVIPANQVRAAFILSSFAPKRRTRRTI